MAMAFYLFIVYKEVPLSRKIIFLQDTLELLS